MDELLPVTTDPTGVEKARAALEAAASTRRRPAKHVGGRAAAATRVRGERCA